MPTPNNDDNNGGSVGGKSFDRQNKLGTVFTPQEREREACKKGVCVHCSRKTHEVTPLRRTPLTNDHIHKGLCIEHNLNVVPPAVAEQWKLQFQQAVPTNVGGIGVNQNPAGLAAGNEFPQPVPTNPGKIGVNPNDPGLGGVDENGLMSDVQIPIGPDGDASTVTDSQWWSAQVVNDRTDVSGRLMEDGNGKVGKYTGKFQIETNISNGLPVYIPTGRGRMEYFNKSVYDGEWKDGLWHGYGALITGSDGDKYEGQWIKGKRVGLGQHLDSDGNQYGGKWKDDCRDGNGSFTHHSGWTVDCQWEKDRCIECNSISGLTVANYESAYEWAQQQEATAVIPPLVEAIEGLGINMSRFLEDRKRQVALYVASKEGNMDEVKRLLEDDAEVDKEDKDGFTALDVAILHGRYDIAKELCEKKNINTDWLDDAGQPLHWAAGLGRVNVVKKLIDKGGDIEVKDEYGWTPLHYASRYGHLNVVEFLVEYKAGIHTTDNIDNTPLHSTSYYGHLNVVKFLVENKADIEAKNTWRNTPLHWASWQGKLEVVKCLVENKADITAKNNDGRTPLHEARKNSHLEVVTFLVNNKADTNAKNKHQKPRRRYRLFG